MKVIKNILGRVYLIYGMSIFMLTVMIVYIPIWIISSLPEPRRARALHRVFRAWMGFFMPFVGCPVIRRGKEHFKKGENYVVVLNHNSLADIPVSSPWIPGANKTLAKVEMAKTPLFGMIYKTGSILLDRKKENSRRESFTKMQETLDIGINLCLYPEGTRNKTDKPMQPFFDGAFVTAIRAQKPIIPGLIFNTNKVLPHNKKLWARPMPIHIHFLEAIPTAGLALSDAAALKERVHKIMEDYYVAHLKRPA